MNTKGTIKDLLWNGLPVVFYKKKYIIFSPYIKKLCYVNKEELKDKRTFEELSKAGFFSNYEKQQLEFDKDRLSIVLYLTENCNLKCIYCFDSTNESCIYNKSNLNMSKDSATSMLKQVIKNYNSFFPKKQNQVKLSIFFFGGEPTLNLGVIKAVVEFLEKEKIDTIYMISTNLVTSEETINYLISKNFRFNISCDGPPRINNLQRPFKMKTRIKPSSIIERNIRLLTSKNARIRTKAVVTNKTIKDMPDIVRYLSGLGVNHIRLEAVLIDGRAKDHKFIEIQKFNKYFLKAVDEAVKISKKTGRKIWISNLATKNLFSPRDYFCWICRGNRIIIMPNGKIVKCIRRLHEEKDSPFNIGKIENNQFNLNKEKYNTIQSISVNNIKDCKNCFAKYICSGICPNENFSAIGSFNGVSKNKCESMRSLIRDLIIKMYVKSYKI